MSKTTVTRVSEIRLPTEHGEFQLGYYSNSLDDKEHLTLHMGDIANGENVLVRVHSECLTGDIFGSRRCDCGEQLDHSLQLIAEEGRGLLIYLRQEGRGIGLLQKMHAYNLQDKGHDTVDANLMLGHAADERDYTLAALILQGFGITSVRLITNNPDKIESLESNGIVVNERTELQSFANADNSRYLTTKAERMKHMLQVPENGARTNEEESHESQSAD